MKHCTHVRTPCSSEQSTSSYMQATFFVEKSDPRSSIASTVNQTGKCTSSVTASQVKHRILLSVFSEFGVEYRVMHVPVDDAVLLLIALRTAIVQ
jgi:hypothetical protein